MFLSIAFRLLQALRFTYKHLSLSKRKGSPKKATLSSLVCYPIKRELRQRR